MPTKKCLQNFGDKARWCMQSARMLSGLNPLHNYWSPSNYYNIIIYIYRSKTYVTALSNLLLWSSLDSIHIPGKVPGDELGTTLCCTGCAHANAQPRCAAPHCSQRTCSVLTHKLLATPVPFVIPLGDKLPNEECRIIMTNTNHWWMCIPVLQTACKCIYGT